MGIGSASLVSAVFALWWDLGNVHSFHNADDLVPVMASLWHWTPFYWGEDRFGMTLALLASPFKDPLTNLLIQNWLAAFFGFLGLALLPVCVSGMAAIPAGLLGAAIFIMFAPGPALYAWFGTGQCYGAAMGFGAAGLALLNAPEKPGKIRMVFCAILIFLSIWTNSAMPLVLLPLTAWNAWKSAEEGKPASRHLSVAIFVFASFTLVWLGMRSSGYMRPYSIISPMRWAASWITLTGTMWDGLLRGGMATALAAALMAGLLAFKVSPSAVKSLKDGLALLFTGAVYCAVIALIGWVADRAGDPRYTLPVLALFVSSAALSASALAWFRKTSSIGLVFLLVVLATVRQAGPPSPGGIRPALDRSMGAATPDIIRLGATHVAGDYSRVWPAVFHANMVLYKSGTARTIWALAYRGAPTRYLWKKGDPRTWKIAVLHGDNGLTPFSPEMRGARLFARTPAITVFQPAVR